MIVDRYRSVVLWGLDLCPVLKVFVFFQTLGPSTVVTQVLSSLESQAEGGLYTDITFIFVVSFCRVSSPSAERSQQFTMADGSLI